MAKEKPEGQTAEATEPQKKKFPVKTAIVIGAVGLVEAVIIVVVFLLASGPDPITAAGTEPLADTAIEQNKTVEILVANEKFPNAKGGRVCLYDTEIYIQTTKKHQQQIETQVKDKTAQITSRIRTIIGRADPAQLLSPDLTTLSRQIKAMLDEKLGVDEGGKSLINEVLVRKCTQYRL